MSTAAILPGLSPFTAAQQKLFLGRKRQVDDLLSIMQSSRFIGVVGQAGSGKTSLIQAGLIPALERGFDGYISYFYSNPITTMSITQNFNKGLLICLLLLASANYASAQMILPSTLNVIGATVNKGYYSFDWSVGESAAVSTLANSILMVTQGVLQYHSGNVVEKNVGMIWFPNEVKLFPNPVRNILEIDFKHLVPGSLHFELFNNAGQLLWQKDVQYNGVSLIEKLNMSGMPTGQYTLYLYQSGSSDSFRKYYKRGAFKIVKVN